MIIINLGGIFVGIATAIIGLLLELVLPDSIPIATTNFISAHIFILVGMIAEFIGAKPRFFFIPTWFIGMIIVCVMAFERFGNYAYIYLGSIIALTVFGLAQLGKTVKANSLRDAKQHYDDYHTKKSYYTDFEKREKLAKSLSYFSFEDDEFREHHKAVFQDILKEYSPLFTEERKAELQKHINTLDSAFSGHYPSDFGKSHKNSYKMIHDAFGIKEEN